MMRATLHRWRPDANSPQRGFTLIEVLVALGLSLVLISAIYSAISLHWRFETAGRERIERAQISLAVIRMLTEDVGCVTFLVPVSTEEDSANSSSTGSASTSSTNATSTSSTGTATGSTPSGTGESGPSTSMNGANSKSSSSSATPMSLGVVGTADYLQLDISYPVREEIVPVQSVNAPASATPAEPVLSENVRVTWAMVTPTTPPTDARGIRALVANPALARQVVDRLHQSVETEVAGTSPNTTAPVLEESSILAREVVSLSFRYYDGYSWTSEWDSVTSTRLPRAIEVTIGFLKPELRRPGELNLPGSETVVPMKHVIFVPGSSPVSGDEL